MTRRASRWPTLAIAGTVILLALAAALLSGCADMRAECQGTHQPAWC